MRRARFVGPADDGVGAKDAPGGCGARGGADRRRRRRAGGVGAELAAQIGEELFDELDGPVIRVAAKDVPMPFSPPLERYVLPGPEEVVAAVRRLL